jgi:hypothetical protein
MNEELMGIIETLLEADEEVLFVQVENASRVIESVEPIGIYNNNYVFRREDLTAYVLRRLRSMLE